MSLRARDRARREEAAGSIISIEAVFVTMFFATAIAFVATQDTSPSQPTAPIRAELYRLLRDAMLGLEDMSDEDYGNKLQRYAIESINGHPDNFRRFLRQGVNDQAEYSVKFRTMDGERLLFQDRPPTGETVGWSTMFSILQDTAMVIPELQAFDGRTMGLGYEAIPLRNGYVLSDREIPVTFEATTADGVVQTSVVGVRLRGGPTVTVGLAVGEQSKAYLVDQVEEDYTLRITEQGSATLPAGTTLSIRVPPLWANVTIEDLSSNWTNKAVVAATDGATITATLVAPIHEASVDFLFSASKPDDSAAPRFDILWATLDEGKVASAPLVVQGRGLTVTAAGPSPRGIVPSIPIASAPGTTSAWSMVFPNPSTEASVLDPLTGECISGCKRVERITIRADHPIFGPAPPGWTGDGTQLSWVGSRSILAEEALELSIDVALEGSPRGQPFEPTMRASFPSVPYAENFTGQSKQSTWIGRALPDKDHGYGAVEGTHDLCSEMIIEGRWHRGCGKYVVTSLHSLSVLSSKIAKGADGVTLSIENGSITKPGDTVTIKMNFASVQGNLTGSPEFLGSNVTKLTIYHPWTKRNSSMETWSMAKRWMTTSSSTTLQQAWQIPTSSPFGSYIVVAERELNLTGGAIEKPEQVIRKATWFHVGPLGAPDQKRTIYNLDVVAWLPDWG